MECIREPLALNLAHDVAHLRAVAVGEQPVVQRTRDLDHHGVGAGTQVGGDVDHRLAFDQFVPEVKLTAMSRLVVSSTTICES